MKNFGPGGGLGNPLNIGTPAGRRNAGGYYMMKQQERMRHLQQQRMRHLQQQHRGQQPFVLPPLHHRQTNLSYTAASDQSAPDETGSSGKWIFFIILAVVLFFFFA